MRAGKPGCPDLHTTARCACCDLCRSILPLEAAGATIERNIRELLARHHEALGVLEQGLAEHAEQAAGQAVEQAGAAAALSAASLIALTTASGDVAEFEFGEMVGAGGGGKAGSGGATIALTATSGEAGGAPPRRVQFADGMTDIEMGRSSDGGAPAGDAAAGAPPGASPSYGQVASRREPSLLEVELASGGASPLISPRKDGASAWLHD